MKKHLSLVLALILAIVCPSTQGLALSSDIEGPAIAFQTQSLAYMDLKSAPSNLQEQIVEDRNDIIFNHSAGWVADGWSGGVVNVYTGELIRELPEFHEVFPSDWDIPVDKTSSNKVASSTSVKPQATDEYSTIYNNDVYLYRAGTTDASPFALVSLGPEHLIAYTYASRLTSSETCNIGYSNYNTGDSLGYATNLGPGEALFVAVPSLGSSITASVRASTYSAPGWATMVVVRSNDPQILVR